MAQPLLLINILYWIVSLYTVNITETFFDIEEMLTDNQFGIMHSKMELVLLISETISRRNNKKYHNLTGL